VVPVLVLRRRRNQPSRPGEEDEVGEAEVELLALLARAKPLLTEPVKELGRTARTLSLRLIRKNANEAC
jgi:hypothetical protein